jgi:hypothetical protein
MAEVSIPTTCIWKSTPNLLTLRWLASIFSENQKKACEQNATSPNEWFVVREVSHQTKYCEGIFTPHYPAIALKIPLLSGLIAGMSGAAHLNRRNAFLTWTLHCDNEFPSIS